MYKRIVLKLSGEALAGEKSNVKFDNEVIKEKFSNEVGGEINWVNIILGGKCKHCREKLKN